MTSKLQSALVTPQRILASRWPAHCVAHRSLAHIVFEQLRTKYPAEASNMVGRWPEGGYPAADEAAPGTHPAGARPPHASPEKPAKHHDGFFVDSHAVIEGEKFRDLLERADELSGVAEIWWRVIRKRIRVSGSNQAVTDDLARRFLEFPWKDWLPCGWELHLSVRCDRSELRSSAAVREALTRALGSVMISPPKDPRSKKPLRHKGTIDCRVTLFRDTLSVYLPLGLEPWHHRWYKSGPAARGTLDTGAKVATNPQAAAAEEEKDGNEGPVLDGPSAPGEGFNHRASLREDYAAAIVLGLAQWLGQRPRDLPQRLFVPFSGTGTFALEYLSMVWELGHSLVGCRSALEASSATPHKTLGYLRERALHRASERARERPVTAWLCDLDPRAQAISQRHCQALLSRLPEQAQKQAAINLTGDDAFKVTPHQLRTMLPRASGSSDERICMLLNPPFGERLHRPCPPADFGRIGRTISELAQAEAVVGAIICPDKATTQALLNNIAPSCDHREQPFSYGRLRATVVYFRSRH